MTKPLLVALNLFFIFAYKVFLGGDLTIKQNIPDSAIAGEEFTVEITIEKGDREGFAKWQQTLPQGFIASSRETSGATFSFKNQELKLIWMAIPKEESFSISFDIKTDPDLEGTFDLIGQFSYIEDNQRKDIGSETISITINPKGQLVSNEDPTSQSDVNLVSNGETTSQSDENSDDTLENDPVNNTDNLTDLVDNGQEPIVQKKKDSTARLKYIADQVVAERNDITIRRKIQALEPAKYEVTLTINKGGLNSFGKIEEYLPPNYIVTLSEGNDAMFSFNRNVAKFLWMILPDQETIEIKYYIESTSDELDEATVFGVFSYLINDDPKQLQLDPSRFDNSFGKELLVEEENTDESSSETPNEEIASNDLTEEINNQIDSIDPQEKETLEQEKANLADNNNEEDNLIDEITGIPAPEASVAYKVQIAAGKREVNQQYFIDRHRIQENVNIEYHETWYKYTIGTFPVYKQARDRRNEVWAEENKINDAFVTAYNSGDRISVQEALMISQQKWFK